jgi:hypothetical protein
VPPAIGHLFIFFGIAMAQAALRCRTSFRVYGWHFAAGAPLRLLWGNLVNWVAIVDALRQFAAERIRGQALAWRKTVHVYPAHAARGDAPPASEPAARAAGGASRCAVSKRRSPPSPRTARQ